MNDADPSLSVGGLDDGHPVVSVRGLWKRYGLPRPSWWRSGEGLPWALQDLSLELSPGESLGVVGLNGSGKSTLLKVLAGVSRPTLGAVTIHGTLFPMIELNAGVHVDLTGRENVYLLGAIMGLGRRQIREQMGAIEAFCELHEWFDRPVRMYSSGMLVRLGFAVGVHVDADILLLDEVLSVGDIYFQNKCLRHMESLRARGLGMILVSHNLQRIRRMSHRVLVLDQGRVLALDAPEEALRVYGEVLRRREQGDGSGGGGAEFDFLGIRLTAIAWEGVATGTEGVIAQGGEAGLRFTLAVARSVDQVTVNVALEGAEGASVVWESLDLARLTAGEHSFAVTWRELRLRAGRYPVRIGVGMGAFAMKGFRMSRVATLEVAGDPGYLGLYQPAGGGLQRVGAVGEGRDEAEVGISGVGG